MLPQMLDSMNSACAYERERAGERVVTGPRPDAILMMRF